MQGSQYRNENGWLNDPLSGVIGNLMSSTVPATFGPQDVLYLSTVTTTTGTTTAALAAVPTVNIPVPFLVDTTIPGNVRWKLVSGVQAGYGTLAPNDQAASQKTWVAVA